MPYILSCPTCLVLYMVCALCALVHHVLLTLHALAPCEPRVPRVLVPHMLRALRPLVLYVSRALCAPTHHVPRALHALVFNVSLALCALVPYVLLNPTFLVPCMLLCLCVPHALHVLVPHMHCAIRALVPHVSRVLCALCLMCPRALWSLFPYVTLMPYIFRTLCANITFSALESPCLTLLFFCSFPTFDFFREFTKVRTI